MDKYKISARIIVLIVVMLIVVAGIIFHDVIIAGNDINNVYQNNPGKFWLIGGVGTISFSMLMYLVFISIGALEKLMEVINNKNNMIEAQGNHIINILEGNARRHDDLLIRINENTKDDIERDKKINELDERVKVISNDIDHIKQHIGL